MVRQTQPKTNKDNWIALVILSIVIVLWLLSWWIIDVKIISQDPKASNVETRGLFGDKFGAINSLFSGLAFAGIIFTILLQRRELALQRKELEETREVFKKQNETFDIQRFENTFFNLLTLHRDVCNNVRANANNRELNGVAALAQLWHQFVNDNHSSNDIKNVAERFCQFSIKNDKSIGPYSSNIFHSLKFLDSLTIPNKELYIKIYRAQLSHVEKIILFYTGAQGGVNNKLKPLIEKFHLLHLLDNGRLIDPTHWMIYEQTAYED